MNAIDQLFLRKKAGAGRVFIPFLPAGDPTIAFTAELIPAVFATGADLIEIGFPFSDPIADGPVIQASYTRALKHHLTLDQIFSAVSQVPKSPGQPLVAMTSYSLMYRRGLRQFVQDAQSAGFSGVVVPDLPVEEAEEIGAICRSADFKLILLVTPTTSPSRLAAIVKACTGFVYVVSVVGITGQKAAGSAGIADLIARLRTLTDLPLCVGFGVNTVEQVRELTQLVDGVIVGTALVRLLNNAEADPAAARQAIVDKVGELSAPTRG